MRLPVKFVLQLIDKHREPGWDRTNDHLTRSQLRPGRFGAWWNAVVPLRCWYRDSKELVGTGLPHVAGVGGVHLCGWTGEDVRIGLSGPGGIYRGQLGDGSEEPL